MPGTLFVVATPIGNLEDISARALRVLREVSIIAAEDTRRTGHLLARYAIPTPTTSLHEHNERQKTAALIGRLESGDSVALVSDAGTPLVADPGQRLVEAAHAAGIRVESIPGPSAVMAALAASGFPAETFLFMGFPPTKLSARHKWLEAVKSAGRTVVFFEAPHRYRSTIGELTSAVGPNVPAAVGRELTKAHEEFVVRPISEVGEAVSSVRGEFVIVLDIGRTTNSGAAVPPSPQELAEQLGVLTNSTGRSRRQAVQELARRYGLRTNEVYEALERARE